MSRFKRRPSAAMIVAVAALVMSLGGGAYAATTLPRSSVGTPQIRNKAVTNKKLADHSVGGSKLNANGRGYIVRQAKKYAGKNGAKGDTGAKGDPGATGAPGAASTVPGPQGAPGAQGVPGTPGAPGKDGVPYTAITSLGGTFVAHNDGAGGKSVVGKNGVVLSGADSGSGYAGFGTDALDGLTPADIADLTYTESYTGTTGNTAEPYLKLKLIDANGNCGDDVVFNPTNQKPNLVYPGETQTWDVTDPQAEVGAGDTSEDDTPENGPYPTAIHHGTNSGDVSGEKVCFTEIILGGGNPDQGVTSTVQALSVRTFGGKPTDYEFGS